MLRLCGQRLCVLCKLCRQLAAKSDLDFKEYRTDPCLLSRQNEACRLDNVLRENSAHEDRMDVSAEGAHL